MNLSIATGLLAAPPRGGSVFSPPADPPEDPPAAPGSSATVLAIVPAAHWHAGSAAATLAEGRVLAAGSVTGPGVTAGAEGLGPLAMSDALGRGFWRFTGGEYLDVGAGLTFANRAMATFAVGRMLSGNVAVFGPGNRTGYGAGPTTANTGGAALDTSTSGSLAPYVRGFSRGAQLDAANGHRIIAGAQLQLMGAVSRSTAGGGTRLHLNTATAAASQPSINASGVIGAEIGRYPHSPGSSWARMDLYELVVFDRVLSDAEADAVAAALVANWAIPEVTSQLVLEGDSISAGVGLEAGEAPAHRLGEPGTGRLPGHYRVYHVANSGNRVSHMLVRRDAAGSWATALLPGENVMAFEIGRNDFAAGVSAAEHRDNVVAYLHSEATGVMQRGWQVRAIANIATETVLLVDNRQPQSRQ